MGPAGWQNRKRGDTDPRLRAVFVGQTITPNVYYVVVPIRTVHGCFRCCCARTAKRQERRTNSPNREATRRFRRSQGKNANVNPGPRTSHSSDDTFSTRAVITSRARTPSHPIARVPNPRPRHPTWINPRRPPDLPEGELNIRNGPNGRDNQYFLYVLNREVKQRPTQNENCLGVVKEKRPSAFAGSLVRHWFDTAINLPKSRTGKTRLLSMVVDHFTDSAKERPSSKGRTPIRSVLEEL